MLHRLHIVTVLKFSKINLFMLLFWLSSALLGDMTQVGAPADKTERRNNRDLAFRQLNALVGELSLKISNLIQP